MQTVEAQPTRAPRSGTTLLIAAPTITDPSLRWVDGFRWQPEVAGGASSVGIECGGGTAARTAPAQPAAEEFTPFLVWAAEKCSTQGGGVRDWFGRARRALEAQQSAMVAAEFWDGTIGETLGNRALTAHTATKVTTAAVGLLEGLGRVESALTRKLSNRPGMIHVRPDLASGLVAAGVARFDAGALYSPLGHVIVADAGYTGVGPEPA